jgi:hypothetical protein
MEVKPPRPGKPRPEVQDVFDLTSGLIVDRRQSFNMPTIEPDRILKSLFSERMPPLETAFSAHVAGKPASSANSGPAERKFRV